MPTQPKMRLELTGRHVDITPTLRRLVEAKLAKLERLLNDSAVSAQAVLMREKYRVCAEITLHARGEKFLHGVGRARAWEGSLTQAVEKIAQQAQTVKGKWLERKRRRERPPSAGAADGRSRPAPGFPPERPRTLRTFQSSRQTVRRMSVTDAVREAQASAQGLVVFRDAERAALSVMYRRENGELVLVETEE